MSEPLLVFNDCHRKPAPRAGLQVLAWVCPLCENGSGRWGDGSRCMQCVGFGLVADRPDPEVWETDPVPAVRPPGVMARPCRDCAFRPGSPETADGEEGPPLDRPFYCHQSCHRTQDGYTPVVMFDGLPIGEKVCAGWWFAVTGQGDDPAAAEFADTHPYGAFPGSSG